MGGEATSVMHPGWSPTTSLGRQPVFGSRVWIGVLGFGFRLGFRVPNVELWVSAFRFRVPGFGMRCFWNPISGFGFRVSGFGVRVSGLGSRVSGSGFRVTGPGFGSRVQGPKFSVECVGFKVEG